MCRDLVHTGVFEQAFYTMQNDIYKCAAELFLNDLYDELICSGILDDPDVWCGQTDEPLLKSNGKIIIAEITGKYSISDYRYFE